MLVYDIIDFAIGVVNTVVSVIHFAALEVSGLPNIAVVGAFNCDGIDCIVCLNHLYIVKKKILRIN